MLAYYVSSVYTWVQAIAFLALDHYIFPDNDDE